MARLPVSASALVAQFGPRLGFPPKEGFPGRDEPDRVVPLGRYILTQGGCDETISLFLARVRLPETGVVGHHGLEHEHEDIRLTVLPADEGVTT